MASRRTGFVLDAKSMGLNRSRPASPSSSHSPKCEPCPRQDQASTSTCTQVQARADGSGGCAPNAQCNSSTEPLPTDYYRCLLQRLKDETGYGGQVNFELNNIFVNRLAEIDGLDGQGDAMFSSQLRLVTFQEWVDFLLHVNSAILGNMSDLEEEAYSKIVSYFNSVQGQQQQALEENRKLRKDLCSIIKFVQGGYHRTNWDFEIPLETLTVNQLLGVKADQARPESESEKMAECMKSLVNEIAAKHDEICHLKSQLGALDEVCHTARQKLLLKDQCIAQLNQQLQEINQSLTNMPQTTRIEEEVSSTDVSNDLEKDSISDQGKVEEATTSESVTGCMLQSLSIQDCQETELLQLLEHEMNELLRMHNIQEHKTMETWRKRLSCLYEKLRSERDDTVNKLENIRSWLSLLQSDLDQSCLNSSHSPTEVDDSDSKMLECLRGRLLTLNQSNRELQRKYQRLETESQKSQAECEIETALNQRNSQILKEIADLLCKLGPADFSYNEIYEESSTENPFCVAITEMFDQRCQEEARQEELARQEDLARQEELARQKEELARQKACKSDTKTPLPAKARPAAMAKTKSTTRPPTKPATKPTTTTNKPRSSK